MVDHEKNSLPDNGPADNGELPEQLADESEEPGDAEDFLSDEQVASLLVSNPKWIGPADRATLVITAGSFR